MNNYLNTNHLELFNLSKVELDTYDEDLFDFLNEWKSTKTHINSSTSGSTGTPKVIELSKKAMLQSAMATNSYFNLNHLSTNFICLPVKYIAGKMMIVRAIQAKAKILIAKPNSIPIKELKQTVSFCAMTSYQVLNCMKKHKNQMNLIENLIIGGSPLSESLKRDLNSLITNCFVTFGMTETISHIALNKIDDQKNNEIYECLPHVRITTNKNNQMIIDASTIEVNQLVTNDVISLIDKKHFKWKGRLDNVINTGGIKLYPELIEKKLEKILCNAIYFIDQVPHKELGAQPILIIDHTVSDTVINLSFELLEKYEIPKIIYRATEFIYSGNNKINRSKTKRIILKKYK